MSWIIRDKATKAVVGEFFNDKLRAALNNDKYEAVPVADYLAELNTIQLRGYGSFWSFDPLDPIPLQHAGRAQRPQPVEDYGHGEDCKCKTCNDTAPDEL